MSAGKMRDMLCRPIRFGASLHLRLFLPLAATTVGALIVLTLYSLHKFEEASTFQLRHEALVLSDALEAAIAPALAGEPDVPRIQAHLDRLVATRKQNDIEINVMLLRGNRSAIVASNIPDNVDRTEFYEHRAMLAALESKEPFVFVGRDSPDLFEPARPPSHPDYWVGPGNRFVSVTNPLFAEGRKLGAINTKLSLVEIDRHIGAIRRRVLLAVIVVPLVALLVIRWIVGRGLIPLNRIARTTEHLGAENLDYRFPVEGLPRELRPICARLNDLFERLQAAFQRERRFAADVAHELCTPITELRTLCEVWLEYGPEAEENLDPKPILREALAISTQMERLVTALLALVRSESGQARVKLEETDLTELVRRAWQQFETPARGKSLSCRFELPENSPVVTDRDLMNGILTNLFSNAVAYTPERGSIHCTVESRDGGFRLDVQNSSRDVAAEDLRHLSEPFWRKDPARTDGRHSGLGLPLALAYASLLQLRLELDLPRPDTFRVRLATVPRSIPRPAG